MHNPTSEIKQFVSDVLAFSTEFSSQGWSASKIRGPPSTLNVYGDSSQAWCPSRYNEEEFLEIKFDRAVYATKFKIYENLNGGTVVKIEAYNGTNYEPLWSRDQPEHKNHYHIFSPHFQKCLVRTNRFKITFGCTAANYFSELDAIELIGTLTNLIVCEKTLSFDMPRLLDDKRYSDFEIKFKNEPEILNAHKCIIAIRCQKLFDELCRAQNYVTEINSNEFLIVLDFLYTDMLNEVKLKQLVEIEKEREEEVVSNIEISESIIDHDKWMLCINRIIRFTVKYKLRRLESLLLDYLLNSFFNHDNVLNILVDATIGRVNDSDLVSFNDIRLNNVEFVCLEYIRCNLNSIICLAKVELLPKDVLISLLKSAIL
jgi:hypothetical protein